MLADTHAIRDFGSATGTQAAELAAVAARLAAVPSAAAGPALGPVGERFLAALAEATGAASAAVAELGHRMAAAEHTAYACATGYRDAEHRTAARFGA